MPNSQTERDYDDQGALKRPGRLDFNTLNNKDDVGDGFPGVQKCIRNLLYEGYMEKPIHMNSKKIRNLADGVASSDAMALGQRYTDGEAEDVITAELVDGESIDLVIDTLIATHKALPNDHHTATVGGDLTHDSITLPNGNAEEQHMTSAQITALHTEQHALDSHTVPSENLPLNSKKITNLADGTVATDAMALGQKTVAGDLNLADLAERSYNSLSSKPIGTAGKLTKILDGDNQYKLFNMIDPVDNQDYATKKYHDDNLSEVSIGIIGTTLQYSNDAEGTATETVYTKVKEIIIGLNLRECNLSWQMLSGSGGVTSYSKVYINGVAYSGEFTTTSGSYVSKNVDISTSLKINDLLQIYVRMGGAGGCYINNMRINYDEFVNNDP